LLRDKSTDGQLSWRGGTGSANHRSISKQG